MNKKTSDIWDQFLIQNVEKRFQIGRTGVSVMCIQVIVIQVVMIVRRWRRGIALTSLVLVVVATKALSPDLIARWSSSQHHEQQLLVGFSSGSVEFSPADSIENASQNNDGRRPSDAVTSIEYLHSSTNDDDDDEDDIQYNNQTDFYPSRNGVAGSNSSMEEEQARRRWRVDDACRRLNVANWTTSKLKEMIGRRTLTLYVDDRLRYIYCLVPKAACTSWTRVLLIAGGKVRQKNPNDISEKLAHYYRYLGRKLRPLAWYDEEAIEYRLRNYFKFMFVRHPLERLVSAFRDRLHGDHPNARRTLNSNVLRHLASRQPANLSTTSRRVGGSARFDEFVRYVVDPANAPSGANMHWRPHYNLCHPCHIHYDFIGHYDTLKRDADAVLAAIGVADRVQFPARDRGDRRRRRTADLLAEKYARIPAEHVHLLRTSVYGNDFMLFDFNLTPPHTVQISGV